MLGSKCVQKGKVRLRKGVSHIKKKIKNPYRSYLTADKHLHL